MKNHSYLFTLLLLATYGLSCKKDIPNIIETREWGEANAIKNGFDWQALCSTRLYNDGNRFSLTFNHYNSQYYLRNELNFRNIPFSIGEYFPFQSSSSIPNSLLAISFFTNIEDGDVIGDKYILLKDSAFYLRINAIDYSSGIVTGIFNGHLRKVLTAGPERDPSSPDTLHFDNGTFKARVTD